MNEKPRFWDFYRSYRYDRATDEVLYIYERNRGKRSEYLKPPQRYKWQNISAGILLLIALPIFILWLLNMHSILFYTSVNIDILFIFNLGGIPLGFVFTSVLTYCRTDFITISETDWDNVKEVAYRKSKFWKVKFTWVVMAGMWLIMFLTMGFTPVYIRYLADRALGTPWQAEVRIEPDYENYIKLEMGTQVGEQFKTVKIDKSETTYISISTQGIPEVVKMFLNGEEIDLDYESIFSGNAGHFWADDYFSIFNNGSIYLNITEGENTLELRSEHFSKSWTFNVEYK